VLQACRPPGSWYRSPVTRDAGIAESSIQRTPHQVQFPQELHAAPSSADHDDFVSTTTIRRPAWFTVVLLCSAAVFIAYLDRTNISVASIAMQEQFHWTETTKGVVLSSFFIGYIALQVVSGTLANRYGGKLVLGAAVLWWSLFTLLTPPAAGFSFAALIAARIALGLGEAAVFPASINMIGRWVPAEKRSRAVAICISGLSLGTVVSLPLTGWLVRTRGWPSPFYVFGAVGLVWAGFWFLRIGSGRAPELEHEASAARLSIPWARILKLPAVWAIFACHFANNWTLYLMLAWLPSYFKSTFGLSLTNAGLLSAAPWLATFAMANVSGVLADRMLASGRSAGFVRKLLQTLGTGGSAIFLMMLPQVTSATTGVLVMCCASGTLGLCQAAFPANGFDIAPRYADVIWGISNTFATIPGIIGVAATGWLVDRTGSYNTPFLVTAGIGLTATLVYLVFGSGTRQIE
jgi:MFS transporter, ACS family, solute carrier family 17 (sodium-dependent inorganic phosphate cotransporter), other